MQIVKICANAFLEIEEGRKERSKGGRKEGRCAEGARFLSYDPPRRARYVNA